MKVKLISRIENINDTTLVFIGDQLKYQIFMHITHLQAIEYQVGGDYDFAIWKSSELVKEHEERSTN